MTEARYRPFSNGSQFSDWRHANCWRCAKQFDEAADEYRCEIEQALDVACWDDGTVSEDIARRMGYLAAGSCSYGWMCPEVEWTEAWKVEWAQIKDLTPEERAAYYRNQIGIERVNVETRR